MPQDDPESAVADDGARKDVIAAASSASRRAVLINSWFDFMGFLLDVSR
jgi:hypothetical protein